MEGYAARRTPLGYVIIPPGVEISATVALFRRQSDRSTIKARALLGRSLHRELVKSPWQMERAVCVYTPYVALFLLM